ncbi:META domain-containing protein [Paraflavitalea soli]|uniref:META domain-containing protein n=1 Tax=Paraflavitalea soli TaxID=2315862 RepID=A0A3B7MLG2_9BACT|nr:copper resistance protein NlpE N-terminal domain-containing protein [Paraflavitalea soli]AXY75334.1 META domain-containing protein [Paraflavitalea soli]
MKKITFIYLLVLAGIVFLQCNTPSPATNKNATDTAHNSQNALDWDGIYRGVLPCADCPGIQTTIYLNRDLSFLKKTKYLGKPDTAFELSGKFTWNTAGNTITLNDAGQAISYLVGENTLTQLDMSGSKITGNLAPNYILSKSNFAILERYWKLVELNGKPVLVDSTFIKEPHIVLKDAGNRITGNGGCNGFSGTFEVGPLNGITFSKMVSTEIACPQLDLESQFLNALQLADNFTISADNLVLNKARMAPLARFKSVSHAQ